MTPAPVQNCVQQAEHETKADNIALGWGTHTQNKIVHLQPHNASCE